MSFILNGTSIRPPTNFKETNNTQAAQQQALDGTIGRDFFGSNKRIWILTYSNVNPSDYATIKLIYTKYQVTASGVSWQVTEDQYPVAQTYVHVDLPDRGFSIPGMNYLSDFTLTLTEA